MFDDLKKDNTQSAVSTQNKDTDIKNQVPVATPQPANISDMFGDVDPVASKQGSVDVNKPSAVQSGKMKAVSQTTIPSLEANNETANTQTIVPNQSPPTLELQKMTSTNIPPADNMTVIDNRSSGIMRKIIVAILVIFMLAVVGAGIYYFFLRDSNTNVDLNNNQNINPIVNEKNTEIINEEKVDEVVIDEDFLDDDFDGLSNKLEKIYGTNPLEADSDNDGVFDQDEIETYHTDPLDDDSDNDELSDYEEIYVYFTDPNDLDTDGDNFSDGVEVVNGYDPLGSGKLEDSLDQDNLNTNENL